MDRTILEKIFDGRFQGEPLDEVVLLAAEIDAAIDCGLIRETHEYLLSLYRGTDPEFQKNSLPYHNFRHCLMVVLATARLFHGIHQKGVRVGPGLFLRGVIAAYFHDSGLLLQKDDPVDSGTKYIAGHEGRSIVFLADYARKKMLGAGFIHDCGIIIHYTDLLEDLGKLEEHEEKIQMAGQIVGSADILAQMADRYYLECLPLLFDELKSGGVNRHESALELMEQTAKFYHEVVLTRLLDTFGNTSEVLLLHFQERYAIDRNLYIENIEKNIAYLKKIIARCDDLDCVKKFLKRMPPKL